MNGYGSCWKDMGLPISWDQNDLWFPVGIMKSPTHIFMIILIAIQLRGTIIFKEITWAMNGIWLMLHSNAPGNIVPLSHAFKSEKWWKGLKYVPCKLNLKWRILQYRQTQLCHLRLSLGMGLGVDRHAYFFHILQIHRKSSPHKIVVFSCKISLVFLHCFKLARILVSCS